MSCTNNLEFPLYVKLQPWQKKNDLEEKILKGESRKKYHFAHCKEKFLFLWTITVNAKLLMSLNNSMHISRWLHRAQDLWRCRNPNKKSEQVSVSSKTRIQVSRTDWRFWRLNSVHHEECLPLSETKLMLFLKPANSSPRPHPSIKSHK